MKELIALSMKSIGPKMNANKRKFCFEVFGYDFIIDADKQLWLIEVNTNPCLDESSALLKQLIPRMLDDALRLTIDAIFPLDGENPLPPLE
jgi:glutathione synthase/RimK-type ligase-like ATP-grasp enzyme